MGCPCSVQTLAHRSWSKRLWRGARMLGQQALKHQLGQEGQGFRAGDSKKQHQPVTTDNKTDTGFREPWAAPLGT